MLAFRRIKSLERASSKEERETTTDNIVGTPESRLLFTAWPLPDSAVPPEK
jgi:hypothetical protein